MLAIAAGTFSHAHIAATAGVAGLIAGAIGGWRFTGRERIVSAAAAAAITGLAVYLWRASANMAQLNNDGINGFSANDWLAPVIVFIALSVYADLRSPPNPARFAQVRAAATIVAFAVNVITI
jgi:hypothetical protein